MALFDSSSFGDNSSLLGAQDLTGGQVSPDLLRRQMAMAQMQHMAQAARAQRPPTPFPQQQPQMPPPQGGQPPQGGPPMGAQPQQGGFPPQSGPGGPGFPQQSQPGGLGSLFQSGAGGVSPMTLAGLALAGGNGSATSGIGNMANMLAAQQQNQQQLQQQRQSQKAVYDMVIQSGGSPQEAMGAAMNPQAWNMMQQRKLEEQKLHRPIPNSPYGMIDPATGKPIEGLPNPMQEDIKSIVQGLKDGSISPQQAMMNAGRSVGGATALKAEALRQGVNLADLNLEYKRAEVQMRGANSAQVTRLVGLSQSVDKLIPEVGDLAAQMKNSGIKIGNMAEMNAQLQANANSPRGQLIQRYITAIAALKSEMAQAENGGYAPHENAWTVAKEQLDKYQGEKAMLAGLGEIQRILRIRIAAVPGINQYGPGMGNRYLPGGNQQPDWLQSGQYGPQGQLPPGGGPPQGMQGGGMPKINSIEDARKLPSGTHFLDPNGIERVVP